MASQDPHTSWGLQAFVMKGMAAGMGPRERRGPVRVCAVSVSVCAGAWALCGLGEYTPRGLGCASFIMAQTHWASMLPGGGRPHGPASGPLGLDALATSYTRMEVSRASLRLCLWAAA